MKTFSITVVTLKDFCNEVNLDINDVNEYLLDSSICFGTNDDTLIKVKNICNILGIFPPKNIDLELFVSLGN